MRTCRFSWRRKRRSGKFQRKSILPSIFYSLPIPFCLLLLSIPLLFVCFSNNPLKELGIRTKTATLRHMVAERLIHIYHDILWRLLLTPLPHSHSNPVMLQALLRGGPFLGIGLKQPSHKVLRGGRNIRPIRIF